MAQTALMKSLRLIRTKNLNFPQEVPAPPDPETALKLDDMIGRALGASTAATGEFV